MMDCNHKLQRGFSLIELMVSMLLGLFLLTGVGMVYISSKETYALRNQVAELDENARVAMRALREHIEHAGYASMTGVPVGNYILPSGFVPSAATCPQAGNTNIVDVTEISSSQDRSSAFGGDTIGLAFLADQQLDVDCTMGSWRNRCLPAGATDPEMADRPARMIYNSFKVASSNGVPSLMCGGSLNAATQPLAQGIEVIQFRYGVDTNADKSVDNYWDAAQVAASSAWGKILEVQVALLVRTVDPVFPDKQSSTYQLFDNAVVKDDRYKRSVYTMTVLLRNIVR